MSLPTVCAAEPPPPGEGSAVARSCRVAITRATRPAIADAEPRPADPGRAVVAGSSRSGGWLASLSCGFHVYGSLSLDGPIAYGGPLVELPTSVTSWVTPGLSAGGTTMFGVRAFNADGEEQNADCAVSITLDEWGNDITDRPGAPYGLRVTPTAAAGLRVEWWNPATAGPTVPAGFSVYCTAGSSLSYATAAATVPYSSGFRGGFVANLSGLTSGTSYSVGVRAFNGYGTETNTTAVSAIADGTGPSAVGSLVAVGVV